MTVIKVDFLKIFQEVKYVLKYEIMLIRIYYYYYLKEVLCLLTCDL